VLVLQWERLVKSIMTEAEWRMQKKIPTFDECKEVGTISVGVEPTAMTAAFACGIPVNSFVLSQLDSRGEAMRLISYSARLLNDIATYKVGNIMKPREMCYHMNIHYV